MKRILIPTDFSENAFHALRYVTELFGKEPVEFFILNSFENQMSTSTSRVDIGRREQLYQELKDEADKELEKTLRKIQPYAHPEHIFETQTSTRILYKEIIDIIESHNIDLVVMGSKGRTEAREIFMGSNTLQVLRKIKGCPVITVPKDYEFESVSKIALASAFKRKYTETQINLLKRMAKAFNAKIQILYIAEEESLTTDQKKHLAALEDSFEDISYGLVWLPETSHDKSKIINDYVKENRIQMLCMIFYKHNFIDRLFREHVVKKIGFHTTVPFLVIPDVG